MIRFLLLLAGLSTAGCGVAYTSIRQEPDGSYILSGSNNGIWRRNGQVFHCTADGDKMKCQLTAEN
jgi:hypothetical protein